MRRLACAIGMLVSWVALSVALVAQSEISLSGRVMAADTGRPITSAVVTLQVASDVFRTSKVDTDGRFKFSFQPGRYHLTASAPGYFVQQFGFSPNLGDTPIVIEAGKPVTVDFKLLRGGTISGIVTNDLKEPVVDAQVRAINAQDPSRYRFAASTKTDDHGSYRLSGLLPGDYYVGVADGLAVTLAPAAHTLAAAQRIKLGPPAEVTANIRTAPSPAGRIEASLDGAGMNAIGQTASLFREGDDFGLWPSALVQVRANRIDLADVPVGKWVLVVRPGSGDRVSKSWARQPVTVAAGQTATPTVLLHPGGVVSGRLDSDKPFSGAITLAPFGIGHPEAGVPRGVVGSDKSFRIANVAPGDYRWTNPGEWILSAFANDKDISDTPLTVGPDVTIADIRITLSEPARITGTVRDAGGHVTTAGAIVVATADSQRWSPVSRGVRLTRADTEGYFEVTGLPAGRYHVAHVDRLAAGQLWDPAFLRTLAQSREVTLAVGGSSTIELRLK